MWEALCGVEGVRVRRGRGRIPCAPVWRGRVEGAACVEARREVVWGAARAVWAERAHAVWARAVCAERAHACCVRGVLCVGVGTCCLCGRRAGACCVGGALCVGRGGARCAGGELCGERPRAVWGESEERLQPLLGTRPVLEALLERREAARAVRSQGACLTAVRRGRALCGERGQGACAVWGGGRVLCAPQQHITDRV